MNRLATHNFLRQLLTFPRPPSGLPQESGIPTSLSLSLSLSVSLCSPLLLVLVQIDLGPVVLFGVQLVDGRLAGNRLFPLPELLSHLVCLAKSLL